jgi:hypothetical protein
VAPPVLLPPVKGFLRFLRLLGFSRTEVAMSLWRHELVERLASLGLKPAHEADIVEELAQHLDDRVLDLVARGADPAAAHAAALADLDAPGELARRSPSLAWFPTLTGPV